MSQEVVNDLNQLHATFLETANKNEITCDDIQRLVSFTEEFHQNIVIAHESGLVSSDCNIPFSNTKLRATKNLLEDQNYVFPKTKLNSFFNEIY